MRTIELGLRHRASLYQTIFELPAGRYAVLQHYLVMESGIGADVASLNRHFERLYQQLAAEHLAEAADEAALLHHNFSFALEQFSPRHLAFGCLVAEVDGQPVTDLSEEGLRALLDRLSGWGLTEGLVAAEVADVKKNCRPS